MKVKVGEAAVWLGVSRWTVYNRIKAGELEVEKVGNTQYVLLPDGIAEDVEEGYRDDWRAETPSEGDSRPPGGILEGVVGVFQSQLEEKDRQHQEKDKQIGELHLLLANEQQKALPPPIDHQEIKVVGRWRALWYFLTGL